MSEPAPATVLFVMNTDAAPVLRDGEGPIVALSVIGLPANDDDSISTEPMQVVLAIPAAQVNDVRRALRLAYLAIEPEDRNP